MKSQLALQCPNVKMYLHTKAYIELDYQRPLLVLWIPKMLTLLELMKVLFNPHWFGMLLQTGMPELKQTLLVTT